MGIGAALVLAVVLEAGGDALVRYGLRGPSSPNLRALTFAAGVVLLFVYSLSGNVPRWDFGRLLSVYIFVFFVVAQLMAFFLFKEDVKLLTLVGGALIVADCGGRLGFDFLAQMTHCCSVHRITPF